MEFENKIKGFGNLGHDIELNRLSLISGMPSPAFQSNIIEYSPDGICTVDQTGYICYLNNALIKLIGYENKSDIINKSWTDFVDRDLELFIKNHVIPIVLVSQTWQGELCLLTKNKERLFADVTMIKLNQTCFSLLIRDITGKRNFDSELNNRQLRLSMINFLSKLIISDTAVYDVIRNTFNQIYRYFPNTRISYWKKTTETKFVCELVKESPIYRDLDTILKKESIIDNSLLSIMENNNGFCYIGSPLSMVLSVDQKDQDSISFIQPVFLHKTVISLISMEFFENKNKGYDFSSLLSEISDYFSLSMLKEQSVTERDIAVNIMRQSESKYQNLIETIDDLVFTISKKGKIISANQAFEKLTGWGLEFIVNRNLQDFLCPENSEIILNEIIGQTSPKKDKLLECKFLTINNTTIDIELKIVPDVISNKINSIICVGRDITERKRKEIKIREQASLIELIHDSVIVIGSDKKIKYLNYSAKKLFEIKSGEILGKRIEDLFSTAFIESTNEAFETLKNKNSWVGEISLKLDSGKEIIIESSWSNIAISNDNPDSILIINTDLTEKKEMETQFYRKQRMESLGTLSSGIAHDFNNILTPILISLDFLKQKYHDNTANNIIETLQQTVNRGTELVKKILSFSKGMNIKNKIISPSVMIKEMLKIITETFPKSIMISIDIQDNLWNIKGDATQLDQVVLNILVNARDAMPNGGEIKVKLNNCKILNDVQLFNSVMKTGDYVSISISDTGSGIDPIVIEKIFEPFYTTKPIGKGTGLGLSTSYAIIKSHNGHIEVKSNYGKGTVFIIYIPKSESEKIQEVAGKILQHNIISSNDTVLIVDDEPAILEMYSYLLHFHGYKLLSANDGVEAFNIFKTNENKIDTIITDINMPNMNGITLAKLVREKNKLVKIIGATGNSENANIIDSENLFDFVLEKPFKVSSLYKALSSGKISDPDIELIND